MRPHRPSSTATSFKSGHPPVFGADPTHTGACPASGGAISASSALSRFSFAARSSAFPAQSRSYFWPSFKLSGVASFLSGLHRKWPRHIVHASNRTRQHGLSICCCKWPQLCCFNILSITCFNSLGNMASTYFYALNGLNYAVYLHLAMSVWFSRRGSVRLSAMMVRGPYTIWLVFSIYLMLATYLRLGQPGISREYKTQVHANMRESGDRGEHYKYRNIQLMIQPSQISLCDICMYCDVWK